MIQTRPSALRLATCLTLLASTLLLGACAGGVRGEAPFAQVTGWEIDGRDLLVDLRLRNVNDDALKVQSLALTVTLDEDLELFRHQENRSVEIAAGGFETLRLEGLASTAGTARLEQLAAGEVPNLPYRLQGTIQSERFGELAIERSGRIYTVPGRPGAFR